MTRVRNANRLNGERSDLCHNKVVLAVAKARAQGRGALLSADATIINSKGHVVNTGTIAGRGLVKLDAENVNNLGGRIAGGSIGINARNDLNNIGIREGTVGPMWDPSLGRSLPGGRESSEFHDQSTKIQSSVF